MLIMGSILLLYLSLNHHCSTLWLITSWCVLSHLSTLTMLLNLRSIHPLMDLGKFLERFALPARSLCLDQAFTWMVLFIGRRSIMGLLHLISRKTGHNSSKLVDWISVLSAIQYTHSCMILFLILHPHSPTLSLLTLHPPPKLFFIIKLIGALLVPHFRYCIYICYNIFFVIQIYFYYFFLYFSFTLFLIFF